MRPVTQALTTIRRSPYQAIASIMMVAVTFFVAFSFSLLILGADQVLKFFETRPQVIAFFKLDANPDQISAAEKTMGEKPYVKDVLIVTQEGALKIYQENNQEESLLLDLVTADILPASIEVSAHDIAKLPTIREDLAGLEAVDDVDFQATIISKLESWTRSLRVLGLGTIIVLATLSFLIITVIIALKASHQKKAINIMRMIGATKGYIKLPFMIEGMFYGLGGSLLGWVASYSGLLYLTPDIDQFLGEINLLPISLEFWAIQLGLGLVAGIWLGAVAGLLAVQRLIKR